MQGRLATAELESSALKGNPLGDPTKRPILFYLPPGYDDTTARFPAVYFLHGFPGSVSSWTGFSPFAPNVPERLDALIAEAIIPPILGIFVDGWTAFGGTQWVNSPAVGYYRDYVAEDVVSFCDAKLRTIPRADARAVVGKSSGGYGALVMACHHASVFGHVAAHSPDAYFEYCYLPEFPHAAAALQGTDPETWLADMRKRGRERKLAGDDHSVLNVLAMAAFYSPKPGALAGLELPFEPETGRIRPDVWARWLEHDPVRFLATHADSLRMIKRLFIDCGSRDEFNLRWGARMIAESLRVAGIGLLHEEFEDGHRDINYRFMRSLTYLAPHLSRT